jgi:hypothetical protein
MSTFLKGFANTKKAYRDSLAGSQIGLRRSAMRLGGPERQPRKTFLLLELRGARVAYVNRPFRSPQLLPSETFG